MVKSVKLFVRSRPSEPGIQCKIEIFPCGSAVVLDGEFAGHSLNKWAVDNGGCDLVRIEEKGGE